MIIRLRFFFWTSELVVGMKYHHYDIDKFPHSEKVDVLCGCHARLHHDRHLDLLIDLPQILLYLLIL